ncbi:unnamed protein product, partial [Choristocarpus tenellus]
IELCREGRSVDISEDHDGNCSYSKVWNWSQHPLQFEGGNNHHVEKAQMLEPDAKPTRGAKQVEASIHTVRAWISVEGNNEVANVTLQDKKDQLLEEPL